MRDSVMTDDYPRIGSHDAIDMALSSGDLLYRQQDETHDWALTLIISNLFELVAQEAEPGARFEQGFKMIMGDVAERELPFGWHPRFVAEAIRNMFDHGMILDRMQPRSYRRGDRVEVAEVGFIPPRRDNDGNRPVFDIEELARNKYGLMVSPQVYWDYVKAWSQHRAET